MPPELLGWQAFTSHAWLVCSDRISLLLWLASTLNPPNLYLPNSWDYIHLPPFLSPRHFKYPFSVLHILEPEAL
jgi:hypothetical protein